MEVVIAKKVVENDTKTFQDRDKYLTVGKVREIEFASLSGHYMRVLFSLEFGHS